MTTYMVSEAITLHTVAWKLCSKRARKFFFSIDEKPAFNKVDCKPSVKVADSIEHLLKEYAL